MLHNSGPTTKQIVEWLAQYTGLHTCQESKIKLQIESITSVYVCLCIYLFLCLCLSLSLHIYVIWIYIYIYIPAYYLPVPGAHCLFPMTYCQWPIAHCLLPGDNCPLPTVCRHCLFLLPTEPSHQNYQMHQASGPHHSGRTWRLRKRWLHGMVLSSKAGGRAAHLKAGQVALSLYIYIWCAHGFDRKLSSAAANPDIEPQHILKALVSITVDESHSGAHGPKARPMGPSMDGWLVGPLHLSPSAFS